MKKVLLALFVAACLASAVYSIYLLVNERISPIPGTIVATLGIVVVLWGISLIKKPARFIGSGAIVVFMIAGLLVAGTTGAYAGYEPLSTLKDNISGVVTSSTIENDNPSIPKAVSGERYCQRSHSSGSLTVNMREPIRPPITKWNYEVTTSTYIYLANAVYEGPTTYAVEDYYVIDDGCWQLYEGRFDIPKDRVVRISNAPEYEIRPN